MVTFALPLMVTALKVLLRPVRGWLVLLMVDEEMGQRSEVIENIK